MNKFKYPRYLKTKMPHKEPYEAYQIKELVNKSHYTNWKCRLRILNNDIREFSTVIFTLRR